MLRNLSLSLHGLLQPQGLCAACCSSLLSAASPIAAQSLQHACPPSSSGVSSSSGSSSSLGAWSNAGSHRGYHVWYYRSKQISSKIFSCEEPVELHGLTQVARNRLTFINWAHVMQRLASMQAAAARAQAAGGAAEAESNSSSSSSSSGSGGKSITAEGLQAEVLREACERIRLLAKWYDPRYAGVVVSSLARLQHRDTQLVDAVLEKAIRRMDEAYTRDLAAVCKGLADLGYASTHQWWDTVFTSLRTKLPTDRVPAEAFVSVLVSASRLGIPLPDDIVSAATADVRKRLVAYSPHDVAEMLRFLRKHLGWPGISTTAEGGAGQQRVSEQVLGELAAHIEAHAQHCRPLDLVSFLSSCASLLPQPTAASSWAQRPTVQALLRRLSDWLSDGQGGLAPGQTLEHMLPGRLAESVGVYARLGAEMPPAAAKAHMSAAAASIHIMSSPLRSSLKQHYQQLGLLRQAAALHPEIAKVYADAAPPAAATAASPPGTESSALPGAAGAEGAQQDVKADTKGL